MSTIKFAAVALLLSLAQEGQCKMNNQKREFIRRMKTSKNGPVHMSKPSLAKFLKKVSNKGNLKGSTLSPEEARFIAGTDEELELRLKYYNDYMKYKEAKDKQNRRFLDEDADDADADADEDADDVVADDVVDDAEAMENYGYDAGDLDCQNYTVYQQYEDYCQHIQEENKQRWWDYLNFWSKNNDEDNAEAYSGGDSSTYNMNTFSDLSLKYAGCSSMDSFVEGEDGLVANSVVQYRLCPAQSCTQGSWTGCNSEYGEYMMNLQDFLEIQAELVEDQFQSLCEYCEACTEYNESDYCEDDNCCSHTEDCGDYECACDEEKCTQEEEEYYENNAAPDYEDLFQCMEVTIQGNNYDGYYGDDDQAAENAQAERSCVIYKWFNIRTWWSNNYCDDGVYNDVDNDVDDEMAYYDMDADDYWRRGRRRQEQQQEQQQEQVECDDDVNCEQQQECDGEDCEYNSGWNTNWNWDQDSWGWGDWAKGWGNPSTMGNGAGYGTQNNRVFYGDTAYVGVHCNGQEIQVGLFSDDTCTTLLATEDDMDIANVTGYDFHTETISDFYVMDDCMECGGEMYNDKSNWWYIEKDKDEENDDDYDNQICSMMYESSAKCNGKLADDIQQRLTEYEGETLNEDITCSFIKAVVMGHIMDGFVLTEDNEEQNFLERLFWGNKNDPLYSGANQTTAEAVMTVTDNQITAGQLAALTVGSAGTAFMGAAALYLHQQIEAVGPEGLMANDLAESSLPYDEGTPSKTRQID